jgi:hypothetical protein
MGSGVNLSKVKMTPLRSGNAIIWKKPGQTVRGIYQGSRKTQFDGRDVNIHVFKNGDGETFDVWESAALNRLSLIPKGTVTEIRFTGLKKGKGKRKYKGFEIAVAEGTKLRDVPKGVPRSWKA